MDINEETTQALNALFSNNEWPQLDRFLKEEQLATVSVHVSQNISWFAGHFPEQAVLPGVVQVHWAVALAKIMFKDALADNCFKAVNNLKFKTMIMPEQQVDIVLQYKPEKNWVSVSYQQGNDVFSSATLVFRPL